jgi:hypothetical protein
MAGLFGRCTSPSQGCYLHTEHKQNKRTHSCLVWDSNPRSQCSSRRRQFMPQTSRPRWSAQINPSYVNNKQAAFPIMQILKCLLSSRESLFVLLPVQFLAQSQECTPLCHVCSHISSYYNGQSAQWSYIPLTFRVYQSGMWHKGNAAWNRVREAAELRDCVP